MHTQRTDSQNVHKLAPTVTYVSHWHTSVWSSCRWQWVSSPPPLTYWSIYSCCPVGQRAWYNQIEIHILEQAPVALLLESWENRKAGFSMRLKFLSELFSSFKWLQRNMTVFNEGLVNKWNFPNTSFSLGFWNLPFRQLCLLINSVQYNNRLGVGGGGNRLLFEIDNSSQWAYSCLVLFLYKGSSLLRGNRKLQSLAEQNPVHKLSYRSWKTKWPTIGISKFSFVLSSLVFATCASVVSELRQ